MGKESIKLPRSSYEELRKIIAAYGRLTEPSGLDAITKLSGIHRTRVSDNNAFLATIGIIEGGKLKAATPRGSALARALEHDISDETASAWATIVVESDFLNKVLQAISIRKGMEVSQLETHIAYSAGEPKSDAAMTGARTVVDILRASLLVLEEDGQIKLRDAAVSDARTANQGPPIKVQVEDRIALAEGTRSTPAQSVTLHIEVRVNVTPSELEGLGDRLKGLLAALSQSVEKRSPDSQ